MNIRLEIGEFLTLVQDRYPTSPDRRVHYKMSCDAGSTLWRAFISALEETPYLTVLMDSGFVPSDENSHSDISQAIDIMMNQ